MPEIVGNLHLHTTASDGTGSHDEVAAAAAQAGLDFIVYTDHNIAVASKEGWWQDSRGREILRLIGQEINDQQLVPEYNHLLCHFVADDLNHLAANPQQLIDAISARGGLTFLAHPLERPGMGAAEEMYPWLSWDISGFTGLELWNTMTDVKWQLRTKTRAVIGAYLPHLVLTAPFPEVLAKWDELLRTGQKVVAIGNSDAHAMSFSLGPLRRKIYPYEFLFRSVNTHLLLAEPLPREVSQARDQVFQALKSGHCFVSNDLLASSHGFRFTGSSGGIEASMGDSLKLQEIVTLRISSPLPARLRLLHQGHLVAETTGRELTWQTAKRGFYRVEAYRYYWGWQRGWVYTNPIYVE
ncbi:MAG: CehA/McbA family metallohydrolase [Anaerolineales bacterium]|nr:CehA/McbA family metallohydrolase [Anaerolineales bacterium]